MIQNRILDLYEAVDIGYTFKQLMLNDGFKLVGAGMYGTVWEFDQRLYKINSTINGVYDGFYDWMIACMESDNPALPKFGRVMRSGQAYCVELEPLTSQTIIDGSDGVYNHANYDFEFADAVILAVDVMKTATAQPQEYYDLDLGFRNIMMRGSQFVLNDPVPYRLIQIPMVDRCELKVYQPINFDQRAVAA
jgi:hypothetical protein